jgi:hypothetical protein
MKVKIVNKKKFVKSTTTLIAIIILNVTMLLTLISFCKYPEKYITTWKYQLQQDIARGDKEAIDYYETVYLQNGQTLFE